MFLIWILGYKNLESLAIFIQALLQ